MKRRAKVNPREQEYRFCPSCTTRLAKKSVDRRRLLSCRKCGFVFWNNPKPVVSAIIARKGKVLLIRRAKEPLKGFWCLPGGYIDYEEKPEQALVREAGEETGLHTKTGKLLGVYQIDNDPGGINLDIIYSASAKRGEVRLNDESSDFGYFALNRLPWPIAYKHKEAILDWRKKLQQ